MSKQMTVDEIREKAQALATRANTDAEFNQRLRSDPTATLRAEGIPDEAIADLLAKPGEASEVAGYMAREPSCVDGCTFCCCTFVSVLL